MMGVFYIFNGELTIGSLMAFQSFMNLFLTPVGSFVSSIQAIEEAEGNIERIEDVMNYPADVSERLDSEEDDNMKNCPVMWRSKIFPLVTVHLHRH